MKMMLLAFTRDGVLVCCTALCRLRRKVISPDQLGRAKQATFAAFVRIARSG